MSDLESSPSSQYGVDIRKYTVILARQKVFVIVFVLSAVLCSVALTYIASEKYEAGAAVFYHPVEMDMLRAKETESFGSPVPTPPFKVISQTLRDAVKSEVILRPVVQVLGLDKAIKPEYSIWYERWYHHTKDFVKKQVYTNLWILLKHGRLIEEDPTTAAISKLRKNIDIVTTKDSYIYVLKVKDIYPERAVRIVDAAGGKLVNWLRDEQLNPAQQRLHALRRQLEEKEQEITNLRQEKEELLSENGLVSIPEEETRGLENLYKMELDSIAVNAQIWKLQQEIAEYKRQLQDGIKGNVQSDDVKAMRSKKLFGQIEIEGLKAQQTYMKSSTDSLKTRLQALPSLQTRLENLDLKIDTLVREYQHLKDFSTEVFSQVTTTQGEAKLMHGAVVSSMPVQPIKIYHVALTALLGFMCSVGLVYVLDYLNVRTFFSSNGDRGPGSGGSAGTFLDSRSTGFLLEELAGKIEARGGNLFLLSEDNFVLAGSLDPRHVPATISLPLKKGSVFEHVMTKGEPVLIQDIKKQSEISSSGWEGYRDSSLLAFPLTGKDGSIIGLVSLHNKISPPFTPQDRELGSMLLRYHDSDLETEDRLSEFVKESACIDGRKGRKTVWNLLWSVFRPVIIVSCGIILALLVFFLLRKVGF